MYEPYRPQVSGAPYWVWMLLCLQTTVLGIAVLGAGVAGWMAVGAGAPPAGLLLVLLMAVFPVFTGWVARAWRLRRAWAWGLLTVLSALAWAWSLTEVLLAGPTVGAVLGTAVNTLFLVLLLRPSSRAWGRPSASEPARTVVA